LRPFTGDGRLAVLNGDTAFRIPVTEAVGWVRPGQGNPGRQTICATEPSGYTLCPHHASGGRASCAAAARM